MEWMVQKRLVGLLSNDASEVTAHLIAKLTCKFLRSLLQRYQSYHLLASQIFSSKPKPSSRSLTRREKRERSEWWTLEMTLSMSQTRRLK